MNNLESLMPSLAVMFIMLAAGIILLATAFRSTEPAVLELPVDNWVIELPKEDYWLLTYVGSIRVLEKAISDIQKELGGIYGKSIPGLNWAERRIQACQFLTPKLRRLMPLFFGTALCAWGLLALTGFISRVIRLASQDAPAAAGILPPGLPEVALDCVVVLSFIAIFFGLFYMAVKIASGIYTERLDRLMKVGYDIEVTGPILERRLERLEAKREEIKAKLSESLQLRREYELTDI